MNFDEILTLVIKFILIPLMAWLGVTIVKLLDAWVASITNEKVRKALVAARLELSNAVKDAVTFTMQTFIATLDDPTKITKEQAAKAFDIAYTRTKAIMSDASMDVLKDAAVAINELIQAQIEAAIPVVKIESLIAANALIPDMKKVVLQVNAVPITKARTNSATTAQP